MIEYPRDQAKRAIIDDTHKSGTDKGENFESNPITL